MADIAKMTALAVSLKMKQKVFVSSKGDTLPYCTRTTFPAQKGKRAFFLFLHGAGERGHDNVVQLYHGAVQLIGFLEKNKIACEVIFPQCPEGIQWVDTPWNGLRHTMKKNSTSALGAVLELMKERLSDKRIDRKRVYLSGISMGGYGSWEMLCRCPGTFAGALICCGGADTKLLRNVLDVPLIQFWHGSVDSAVPVFRSRDIVRKLEALHADNYEYHEVRNCDHDSWSSAFNDSCSWQKLFSCRRK